MRLFKIQLSAFQNFRRAHSTIFALSSGYGRCGVAVIRVSGPKTSDVIKNLTNMRKLPTPRTAYLKSIKHPITKEILDKGLLLWFPGPYSFTGEDCCELQVHGSIAVINSILNALSLLPDLRLAKPGEFTRRAFNNGKLDLTEVEGLADLLQAETEAQRKQAFLQTQGALGRLYNNWREILLRSLAHIEAHIDFEETESLEFDIYENITNDIRNLSVNIQQHLDDGYKGELLRNGVKTVIIGEPNVGKSSLLNLLCKRPVAIVTPLPGTTRDTIDVTLNINGYPMVLTDTAGLRSNTDDIIEKEGIKRTINYYKIANLIIILIDFEQYHKWSLVNQQRQFIEFIKSYLKDINLQDLIRDNCDDFTNIFMKNCIVVFNKTDLIPHFSKIPHNNNIAYISCRNSQGIEELIKIIGEELKTLCGEPSEEHPCMNQTRHRQCLTNCLKSLENYLNLIENQTIDVALLAEQLRSALKHLGYLVGVVTNEQILDVIFKDFCIVTNHGPY